MNFDKCIYSRNCNQSEYFSPKTSLGLLCSQSHPNHSTPGDHLPGFCNYRLVLPVLERHVSGAIKSVLFRVWLSLLSMIFLRFTKDTVGISSWFLFCTSEYGYNHDSLIHLSVDEHSRCFQFGFFAIMKRLLWIFHTSLRVDVCFRISWVNS